MDDSLDTSALQALRESTGDDAEFLAELVTTFLDESPGQLAELQDATAERQRRRRPQGRAHAQVERGDLRDRPA